MCTKKYMTMKRILVIVLCSLCVQVLCAQEMLVLPYEATGLTDEQKAMNPERLAYPTELKESIKSEVSFECTSQVVELGPFSVSETKTVMFSSGNLQYQPSTKTWRFAEHQWEVIGEGNKLNIHLPSASWIDLFGWGTGNNPTYTSPISGDFSSFTDWGVNAISNGGNEANMWHTLTKDEWEYLIHGRKNAEKLFGLGTVHGLQGTILLPDDWATPSGVTFTPSTEKGLVWDDLDYYYNGNKDNYSHNTYMASEWDKMESAGAVFLPAAGFRDCLGGMSLVGACGHYWSSTPSGSEFAWNLIFDSGIVSMLYLTRCTGFSVRLVR